MPSSRIKRWNGTAWVDHYDVRVYNGSAWVDTNGNRWDGDSWVPLLDRTPGTAPYKGSWSSNWVGGYNESGSRIRTDVGFQGRFSGTNGRQKAMFGLPYAAIRTALAGSTINAVVISMVVTHTYWNSGSIFQIGTHDHEAGTSPTTYTNIMSRYLATTDVLAPGNHKEIPVANTFGNQLRDGTAAGLILETTSNDWLYYGSVSSMQVTIHYTK